MITQLQNFSSFAVLVPLHVLCASKSFAAPGHCRDVHYDTSDNEGGDHDSRLPPQVQRGGRFRGAGMVGGSVSNIESSFFAGGSLSVQAGYQFNDEWALYYQPTVLLVGGASTLLEVQNTVLVDFTLGNCLQIGAGLSLDVFASLDGAALPQQAAPAATVRASYVFRFDNPAMHFQDSRHGIVLAVEYHPSIFETGVVAHSFQVKFGYQTF